jgi:hypothetical protein
MSEKYELIKGLGLMLYEGRALNVIKQPIHNYNEEIILADDLEALLAKGVRVYGYQCPKEGSIFNVTKAEYDTHQALAINIREIPKLEPASVEEILKLLRTTDVAGTCRVNSLIERIEKAGIK